MPASIIDRRLGHTRIEFSELVQLRASLARSELWSHATNLSEGGLHIRTDTVLDPGTLMDLVLPLPRVEQSLEVRGRVAWSRVDRDPGMGIELVDLSETDRSFLRREVMEGRPREWRREVKVWFEGTREPTRAIAAGSGASLQLISDLGFLRLGSQVVIYGDVGAEAEPMVGSLSEVTLRKNAGIPQLVLSVQAAELEPAPPDETWTHWPPPPVREIAEETDELIIEQALPSAPEVHALERGISCSGSIEAPSRPDPPVKPEPSIETLATAPSNDGWELGELGPERSDWQLRNPAVTLQLPRVRRRRKLWLWWLAAALMATTTVASMSYTQSWIRVRERLRVWWGGLGVRLNPEPTGFSLLPRNLPISVTRAEPEPPASPPPAAVLPEAPLLEVAERRLSIPIRGSVRGSRSYPLAHPAGVAVNLPYAQPLIKYGDFEIQKAGFRSLWIRRRGEGLHVRVFFSESYKPTLSLGEERLSIQLKSGETPTP